MQLERTEFLTRLLDGEFMTSIQLDTPSGRDPANFYNRVSALRDSGVRVVDINANRGLSADSLVVAQNIKALGVEVIPHLTTRDANLRGLMRQILAVYAAHVRNFLVITGDPYETSTWFTKGIFHTDAVGAIKAFDAELRQSHLNLNIALSAAVNQNSRFPDFESAKTAAKAASGADFFMSQPVFCPAEARSAARFYRKSVDKPLLLGIWPLLDRKTLETITEGKISGVNIPPEVVEEARGLAGNRELLAAWAAGETVKLVREIKEERLAQGIYIVSLRRNTDSLPGLVRDLTGLI